MAIKNKGKISYALQAIHIIPLLLFAAVILFVGTNRFTNSMYSQVEHELANVSSNVIAMYDFLYPGDYTLTGDAPLQFCKGDANLTYDFAIIDRVREDTGLDITIFYQDTRILTTVTDENGKRIIGSGAPQMILDNVLATGEPCFYDNVIIYGVSYFSYYAPLFNEDGSTAGMIFVGKPRTDVDEAILKSITPLIAADVVLVLVVAVFTFLYTQKIVAALLQIHLFLGSVSAGSLDARLDASLLKRGDELGDIARSALEMQRSLNTMINQDALTSLANRRAGSQKLHQTMKSFTEHGTPFCVAIADIDFFKKVNDTYGHDCGDQILKNISAKLRQHMRGKGTVARWGGEEFLFIFENAGIAAAVSVTQSILEDIRAMENHYDDQLIKVTMTFGITAGDSADNITDLLRLADEKLYHGKNNGRNQIVQ